MLRPITRRTSRRLISSIPVIIGSALIVFTGIDANITFVRWTSLNMDVPEGAFDLLVINSIAGLGFILLGIFLLQAMSYEPPLQ